MERLEERLALAGDFSGVVTLGGTDFDQVIDLGVDAAGNQFVTGDFKGTANFESTQLTSNGGADVFVAKYSAGGSLLWAHSFGNSGTDRVYTLAVDDTGKVHIGGYFSGTVDFDPSSGTHLVTSQGPRDGYVLTLDSGGNLDRVIQLGGDAATDVRSIEFAAGSMFLAGAFARNADFDPGPGETTVTAQGNFDAYVARYNLAAELQWVRQLGGFQQEIGERVAVDAAGNVVFTGTYRSENTDFDPGPGETILPHGGAADIFVSSFDLDGNTQWVVGIGGEENDTVNDLAVDSAGGIYTTGPFFETVDFDPGPDGASLAAGDTSAAFVWKLNSAGEFEWVKSYDGSISDSGVGWAVAVDRQDQLFVATSIFGTVFFEGTPLTSLGANDAVLLKLDHATGDMEYLRRVGGIRDDFPFAITTDTQGHLYAGGYFHNRVDFDPGDGIENRDSSGSADGYLLRLLDEPPSGTSVVGRHIFYNNSGFDGNDPAAGPADDAAIAPDKSALLPGETAGFANYTSFSRGVNGVMVDVANLANAASLSAADFMFRAGNSQSVGSWSAAPVPVSVSVREGAGDFGSDRVTIIFEDSTIVGKWLEVKLLANANTGLSTPDTFYFGNAIGETGNGSDTSVDASDFLMTRSTSHTFLNPADLSVKVDFNRDKLVNSADLVSVRDHVTSLATALVLLAPPASSNKQSIVIAESDLKKREQSGAAAGETTSAAESEAREVLALDALFAEYGSTV